MRQGKRKWSFVARVVGDALLFAAAAVILYLNLVFWFYDLIDK